MNIDHVLASLGMGRYQFTSCVLFGLVIMYSYVSPVTYVFTAGDLKYRCEIPECDARNPAERAYEPEWLRYTTPYRDDDTGLPRKCQRYAAAAGTNRTGCASDGFDRDTVVRCRDRWVFDDPENTVGTEFGLMCEANKWKLSMVGSVNNFGQFIGIPMSGVVADKFGRKFAMIFCAATSAAICIVQSFSTSYSMFLLLELLSSTVSSGIYTVTFVLAIELVVPSQRVIYYSVMECFYPVGAMLVALIASQTKDWRLLLRIANVPGLLFISLTDESMRWLEIQGKHDRVIDELKRIAKINKKSLPDLRPNAHHAETTTNYEDNNNENYSSILKDIMCSKTIFWRMIKCSVIWIAITLVYYGLTINATDIAGNKYVNFTLVLLAEVPACLFNWLIMEGMSRKMSLSCVFVLSGVACVAYNVIPNDLLLIKLSLFMVGKVAITVAFNIMYLLTAEVFPTQFRVTLLAMCSMVGRIGSMLAPQTTLLSEYFGEYMTMLVFGATALVAAAVTVTLPESKNIQLPDTIDEAEHIGVDCTFLPERTA